jgi:hypothetical protein
VVEEQSRTHQAIVLDGSRMELSTEGEVRGQIEEVRGQIEEVKTDQFHCEEFTFAI